MHKRSEVLSVGVHNEDLGKSTARIIKSASWKSTRVVWIMPTADKIPFRVALAMRQLMFPPNQPFHLIGAMGFEVGHAYSTAINEAITFPAVSDYEYILTMEHDNVPEPDGLLKLIAKMESPEGKPFAAIGGLYWTKGEAGVPQIWGDPRGPLNFRPQMPKPNSFVECNAVGMGFTLFRSSMFKDERLRRPWFVTRSGLNGEGISTQDMYFWEDARKYGYRCAVDCSVLVGHLDLDGHFGPSDTMW